VIGKFLGAVAMLKLALLFTAGLPLVVAGYGDPDWGPIIGGYFAALMLGSAYVAMGLVTSTLSQDQFLALFLGWALCALTLVPEAPFWDGLLASSTVETIRAWGFTGRFRSVERGVIDFKDLAFYASITGLFLYINVALVRWRRLES
jgi:ABC-2 type transport system permease protein